MNQERWKFIERIYHQALELDRDKRDAFIREACAADDEARREVESLIEAHEHAGNFIVKPAFEAAAEAIAEKLTIVEPGRMLGHYKILNMLGAGGMGAVYLAQDSKLGRKIAIKMLPATFSTDSARLRRFQQEARAASATNHPNILTVHEIGEIDGANYIVTEFVDGETLRQRLNGERLSFEVALDVAIQVASALEAAHQAGIAHRDIKPENIMLRRDGIVKVLDFGIAKLVERENRPAGAEIGAEGYFETETGVVIGTAPYMSPEQARSEKDIDSRTDIFSLGVVIYEMIAGRSPFASNSFGETVASVLHLDPPPLTACRAEVPSELEKIVARALRKRREDRYQRAREMRDDLVSLKRRLETNPQPEQPTPDDCVTTVTDRSSVAMVPEPSVSRPRRRIMWGIAAAITTVVAMAAVFSLSSDKRLSSIQPFSQFVISEQTDFGGVVHVAISPDGNYIVYAEKKSGKESLWFRSLNGTRAVPIVPPDDVSYQGLTFSPYGEFVYFVRRRKGEDFGVLSRVHTSGGTPEERKKDVDTPVTFSPDGNSYAFGRGVPDFPDPRSELIIADTNTIDGGETRLAAQRFENYLCRRGIAWSPDGKNIACSSDAGKGLVNVLAIQLSDGKEKKVSAAGWRDVRGIAWLADSSGLLVVASEKEQLPAQIFRVAYPSGDVEKVTNDLNEYDGLSLSSKTKKLVTTKKLRLANIWIAKRDDGFRDPEQITFGSGQYYDLSWTPDGKILASRVVNNRLDLWRMDADGENPEQITFGPSLNFRGRLTPDGRYIVYVSNEKGSYNIWRRNADGSDKIRLTHGNGEFAPRVAPDSKWVFYWSDNSGRWSIWKVSIEGGAPQAFTDKTCWNHAISPDLPGGTFLACYCEGDEPESQRKVTVFPISDRPSVKGKPLDMPLSIIQWLRDGKSLSYYDERDVNIWIQPLNGRTPKRITNFNSQQVFFFDWAPDNARIALLRGQELRDVILLSDPDPRPLK